MIVFGRIIQPTGQIDFCLPHNFAFVQTIFLITFHGCCTRSAYCLKTIHNFCEIFNTTNILQHCYTTCLYPSSPFKAILCLFTLCILYVLFSSNICSMYFLLSSNKQVLQQSKVGFHQLHTYFLPLKGLHVNVLFSFLYAYILPLMQQAIFLPSSNFIMSISFLFSPIGSGLKSSFENSLVSNLVSTSSAMSL